MLVVLYSENHSVSKMRDGFVKKIRAGLAKELSNYATMCRSENN